VIPAKSVFYPNPMLTPKPQLNLHNAREYFREHLCVEDYYSEGQVVSGEWLGLGAEKLALRGRVAEKEFLALCDGLPPTTGERLTLRKNSNRLDGDKVVANRRIFYDFTISPPKSVSVVALRQDDRIIELHNRAVRFAMTELEKFAETRVRKSDQNGERVTGNCVTACFRHDTSRGARSAPPHTLRPSPAIEALERVMVPSPALAKKRKLCIDGNDWL
jgi:conjugative relaxase-like TrwC/TraI family protein